MAEDNGRWHGRAAGSSGSPSPRAVGHLRLFLPERVAEHVEETVGIGFGQALNELVAVLDERRVALLFVRIQGHPTQGKGFHGACGAAFRPERVSP